MKKLAALTVLSLIFSHTITSFAAQSSADVSASAELKQSARADVLGSRVDTIVRQEEYVIGQGDILSVSVYGEGDMAASAGAGTPRQSLSTDEPRSSGNGIRVMMDGRISLKHIGDVEVAGLTLTELADYLKVLYATIYAEPIVTSTLEQSNSLRYTIMGNVANPGILFLDYPLTILQAVARSGGFTEWANREITVVREKIKEQDQSLFKSHTLKFNYDDFISGEALDKNIDIQSGDIIVAN